MKFHQSVGLVKLKPRICIFGYLLKPRIEGFLLVRFRCVCSAFGGSCPLCSQRLHSHGLWSIRNFSRYWLNSWMDETPRYWLLQPSAKWIARKLPYCRWCLRRQFKTRQQEMYPVIPSNPNQWFTAGIDIRGMIPHQKHSDVIGLRDALVEMLGSDGMKKNHRGRHQQGSVRTARELNWWPAFSMQPGPVKNTTVPGWGVCIGAEFEPTVAECRYAILCLFVLWISSFSYRLNYNAIS